MAADANIDLIERARSLVPLLRAHARASEQARRPADEVIEALREARIFDLMVPRAYGGLELDLDTFLEVGLALAAGDASAAWVSTFYIEHNWMLCQFPESFQKELYRERSHVLAPASIAPRGFAERVDGGFRLNGRWQWATGICHAEWALLSARVDTSGGDPDLLFLAVPRNDFELVDTWLVDGLCGTGSHDIEVSNVLVPEERTVSVADMANGRARGARLHAGPLYRTPMLPILGLAASMPAVGLARATLRELQEEIPARESYLGGPRRVDRASIQIRLARALIEIGQAEWLLREIVREVSEVRDQASPSQRVRWLAAAAMAVAQSREVLFSLSEAGGATAHFLDHPLQRAVRDVNVMASHTVFDLDQRLENYGRTLLGLPPLPPF